LLFAGPLADAVGVQWLFTISGIGSIFSAILMFAVPSARLYDRRLQRRLQQAQDAGSGPQVQEIQGA
jgi:DHA3 family macrolide efflux protein-like MFS transporter